VKRIFVYGTLLRGERSHHLLSTSALLGEARTAPGFELCDLGEFPGMVRGGSGSVVGELYLVGPDALPALDRLEGHPEVFFRTAVLLASGEEVEAYLFPADKAEGTPRIAEGDWRRRGG
jgi:gamma-glutamylaminecyclotransferase